LARGRRSPLPELAIQYADFAVWQRRWLQGEVLDSQLAYWRQQLAGAPPQLDLPTDRPRSERQGFRGKTRKMGFCPSMTAELRALSSDQDCTLFVTLLTCFAVLLSRYSAEEDVVVGSPIANRQRTELEELIGFLLNTLVLRLDLSGDPSFVDLLGNAREVVLEAFAHQDLPFSRLVEELQPERHMLQTPLYQVLFVLQNATRGALEL
ncbi:MAG: non-ribosomal peptide synthetase, partial [Deltaproteobacteria bacterium]|nr:non-ribosomal peptide synthetase [Deltaproteobacteria bacterium]